MDNFAIVGIVLIVVCAAVMVSVLLDIFDEN
jgi:hypothetical protein